MFEFDDDEENIKEENAAEEEDDAEYRVNPIIQRINDSVAPNVREEQPMYMQEKAPQEYRSEYVTSNVSKDMSNMLRYTAQKESSNDPTQVNPTNPKKPTTGYYHIEQPTYIENLKESGNNIKAEQVSNLNPSEYVRYIQANKKEEEAMAERELSKKITTWGNRNVVDDKGKTVPIWRLAYTMGDRGTRRFLKATKQDIDNGN